MTEQAATERPLEEKVVNTYRAFGFTVLPSFLNATQIATLAQEVDQRLAHEYDTYQGPTSLPSRRWSVLLESDTPMHVQLLEDPRIVAIARQLNGREVIGIKAQANQFFGSTPWHRDTMTSLRGGVKFIWYYEPLTVASGALRLLPASHLIPDAYLLGEKLRRMDADDVPAVALESTPGDVIAFDMRAWHGSFGGRNRRESSLTYYSDPSTEAEEEALRLRGGVNVRILLEEHGGRRSYLYPRVWLENAEANLLRRRWIRRLTEVGYFGAPGVVQLDGESSR